jgi:geranylgeranyl diphosphate synthase, type II
MNQSLRQFIAEHHEPLETALVRSLPLSSQPHARRLNEALHYALFPGGKRWRPLLTVLGARLCGASFEAVLPAACAMEYLHTSSLIIDDLPAMDDADLRRGRAALHLAVGEDVATLAALSLLNASYALLARSARMQGQPEAAGSLVEEAARCIGSDGMIGGQMVDLALQDCGQDQTLLVSRNLKTTALLELTMTAGARACGAHDSEVQALCRFGEALGMAYQICDDLMDELGEAEQLGKPARQDARHTRASFVTEFGIPQAQQLAQEWVESGTVQLRRQFGALPEVEWLVEAASEILNSSGQMTSCHENPPATGTHYAREQLLHDPTLMLI